LFGKRRLERFEARQEATLDQIGHITAALIVREPGTALSANAYDGLRKQVSIAARDRRQHLARLVELSEAIDNGATTETLRRKCEQWCLEVGLEAVTDLESGQSDWFRIVEGDGPEIEVLTPAWADTEVGHLVQRGTARRSWPAAPPEPVPAETGETEAESPEATTSEADATAETESTESTDDAEPIDEPDEAEEADDAEPASEVAEAEEAEAEEAEADSDADESDEPGEADATEETEPAEAAGRGPTGETEPTHASEETEETEETR